MPTKYFDVDGHAIHVFHAGPTTLPGVPPPLARGERLLFLHGAGSNGGTWKRQLEHFAARHSPVAFDWPGHGRSSGTEALPSIEAYAETALRLADRLGMDRFVPVGTSMGGLVALDLALRAPDRVRGLVLVATAARIELADESLETWRRVMTGRAPQPFGRVGYAAEATDEMVREGWEHQVKTDPRVRYHDLLAVRGADYRSRLAEIRRPALVVHGAEDALATPADAARLTAGLAGAERVEIAGAGHYLYREKPEALHAAVDRFLDRLGSRA